MWSGRIFLGQSALGRAAPRRYAPPAPARPHRCQPSAIAAARYWAATALLLLAGCSSSNQNSSWANFGIVPRSRYDNLQVQNRTLAERGSAQQAEIENLKLHTRNVENQLIRAEEDLARLDDHSRADRKLAGSRRPRAEAGYGGGMPAELGTRLADLADRYPSLHYDEESGVSKFDSDVLFDSGEARLNVPARKMLGEFAEIFQAPEARDLKIMVVGHTDARGIKGREARTKYPNNWHLSASRAVAVVDCLREAGLPENRMGDCRLCPISTDLS